MNIVDLGLISYKDAEALQLETLKEVTAGERENTVYLLEHPKVITLGRQGGAENLHVDEGFLKTQGIELAQTTRGGNITCHFPGQLVAYPIWRVEKRPGGMKTFFHDMEEAVIRTCARFGVTTRRRPGHPGVWVDETRKICSMGIGVKRWVTYHGLALNVGRDVSLFQMITLCGIQGATPTSLSQEAGRDIAIEEVKHVFAQEFRNAFADSAVASDQASESENFSCTSGLIKDLRLNTVCQSAKCPNKWECFSKNVATFLIMGRICTRNCAFCNIAPGDIHPLEADEPARVAEAAKRLELKHVVITSVTRDDLPDGGAGHFAATIRAVRDALPQCTIEVLIPDFQGDESALRTVLDAAPDVLNHNLETVPDLYDEIRPQADYQQSLELLRRAKAIAPHIPTKSGIMVGLGETDDQIMPVLDDLAAIGCDIVTIGQYMQPTRQHPMVKRYVEPEMFEEYARQGKQRGIRHMFSAPLVRSSYNAEAFV